MFLLYKPDLRCSTYAVCVFNETTVLSNVLLYYGTIPKETSFYTALCVSVCVCLCLFIGLPCLPTRLLLYYETTPKRDIQLASLAGHSFFLSPQMPLRHTHTHAHKCKYIHLTSNSYRGGNILII